jgi:hypothetical protein
MTVKPQIITSTGGFINIVDGTINILNNSKYFTAIMMLLMNLGARYISLELSQFHEEILSNPIFRRILIFTVVFISTRDIKVSLISTAVFVILVSGIFNEDSKYCILPGRNNRKITKEDLHYAQSIIDKYNKQNKKDNQSAGGSSQPPPQPTQQPTQQRLQ